MEAGTEGRREGKFDAASNLERPRNDLEREAVDSFRELEKAEAGFEPGLRFGQAMIDLRESLRHGEWMPALHRLGITYRKAQYWMDIRKGKRPASREKSGEKEKKEGAFDWDVAIDWLDELRSKVALSGRAGPRVRTALPRP